MPKATPLLRRLRQRTGVRSGLWAEQVQVNRNHYVNVEGRQKNGSPELFARCAQLLSEHLGVRVEAADLMDYEEAVDARPGVRHSTTGRASSETAEAPEATEAAEAAASAEARERRAS